MRGVPMRGEAMRGVPMRGEAMRGVPMRGEAMRGLALVTHGPTQGHQRIVCKLDEVTSMPSPEIRHGDEEPAAESERACDASRAGDEPAKHEPESQQARAERLWVRPVGERELFSQNIQGPYRLSYERTHGQPQQTRALYGSWGWQSTASGPDAPASGLVIPQDENKGQFGACRTPLCSLSDRGNEFVLEVELPGAEHDSIDVQIGPIEVLVSTEGLADQSPYYGLLALPELVDTEAARGSYRNGMLTLLLPKSEGSRRRHLKPE
jgi:HSP20 family molecular chaperone IbpA